MNILVTGANGFLGHHLIAQLLKKEHSVIATGRGECRLPFTGQKGFQWLSLDFTDPFAVHNTFQLYKPEVVIHAGAMTRVDECEQKQWDTYLVNVEGTVTLLLNAFEHKSFFIFVSTDFVFTGDKEFYSEEDEPGAVNFYGKTKLEGEDAVKEYEYDWAIVRTSLVYGKPLGGKSNILSVVKEKLEKKERYDVVDDQVRTPTYVEDLAAGIVSIIEKKATGIYHIAGADVLTPYQMACMTADHLGLDPSLIGRVTAADFSQPAKRPARTSFSIDKARKDLGYSPLRFKQGLEKTFPKTTG
ncbi:MAG TPA: SDR family oxidoreductase [Chitinophagaceae bacterium]|jgi:dTDP-4-dehydrorhamnose reductase|nr:SDR family oxidoreductase [Chitinophagaceae bacterium]